MRPWFEQVTIAAGESWRLFDRRCPQFPFLWHYHPEYELTLTLNSIGERFVGDHIADYRDGDLVLVGPNLPHAWQSRAAVQPQSPHRALVLWFSANWARGLTDPYPELGGVRRLLADSARGLSFSPDAASAARSRMLAMVEATPALRWLGLVEVLVMLAADKGRQALALRGFAPDKAPRERARLDGVLEHIHAHYTEPIALASLADMAAMSDSQLQRLFKRCTRMTLGEYIAQLRIGHACALLLGTRQPIGQVAEAAGYAQASYFTRQFRDLKGMTPMAFRRRHGGLPA